MIYGIKNPKKEHKVRETDIFKIPKIDEDKEKLDEMERQEREQM